MRSSRFSALTLTVLGLLLCGGCSLIQGHEQEIIDTIEEIAGQVGKPTPTPTATPAPPEASGPSDPVLVCSVKMASTAWQPGITVSTENYVRQYTGGRDKGGSISFIESEVTDLSSGKAYRIRWQDLWNGLTNSPKVWNRQAATSHMASPGAAQNWHQSGHSYTTGHKENQVLADGTRRGYIWLPVSLPQGAACRVRIKMKSTVNRGTAFYSLCWKATDGSLWVDVYKQNQRSEKNSSVWVTVSESFVFYR